MRIRKAHRRHSGDGFKKDLMQASSKLDSNFVFGYSSGIIEELEKTVIDIEHWRRSGYDYPQWREYDELKKKITTLVAKFEKTLSAEMERLTEVLDEITDERTAELKRQSGGQ